MCGGIIVYKIKDIAVKSSPNIDMSELDKISKQYNKYSLWIIVAITLIGLFLVQVLVRDSLYSIIIFNACYALFLRAVYITIWKIVAKNSIHHLAQFYLGASVVRLLLTLLIAVIGILIMGKEKYRLIAFLIDLSAYYLAFLIFDSAFFCIQEKKHKQNN